MDLAKILAQLHQELENLDRAINSLERIKERSSVALQLPENLGAESSKSRRRAAKSRTTLVRKTTGNPD